ncbi:YggT family protein [Polynucleobacter sp. MWH-UH35A]|nr:YggT family protein [Polynucleobacter sp. MWH-UH35A]
MHLLKINFAPNSGNPFSKFLIPLSNWLITPIGKIIPFGGRIDVRSLLASYLLVLVKVLFLLEISNAKYSGIQIPVLALFSLLELALSGLTGLLIVHVFFNWTQTRSPTQILFYEMVEPLLEPIRRLSPEISGIDVSTFVLFLLIQAISLGLKSAQRALLTAS